MLQGTDHAKLTWLVNDVAEPVIHRLSIEVAATYSISSQLFESMALESLAQARDRELSRECLKCRPSHQDTLLWRLEGFNDPAFQYLAGRSRLQKHFSRCSTCSHTTTEAELAQYSALRGKFLLEVAKILREYNPAAEVPCLSLGIPHPEGLGLPNFLNRTSWHAAFDDQSLLDRTDYPGIMEQLSRDSGLLIDKQDNLGRSPLHIACMKGWKLIVQAILESKVDTGAKTLLGSLPLHFAAANGHVQICELLLTRAGQYNDIRTYDCQGKTPYDYSSMNGHKNVDRLFFTKLSIISGRLIGQTLTVSASNVRPEPVRSLVVCLESIRTTESDQPHTPTNAMSSQYRCVECYGPFERHSDMRRHMDIEHIHFRGSTETGWPETHSKRPD